MANALEIVKRQALDLYLTGVSLQKIAKEVNRHHKTIENWKNKYNWSKTKEEYEEEKRIELIKTRETTKERQIKILKAIQVKYANDITKKDVKGNEAINAIKLEAELLGILDKNINLNHTGEITNNLNHINLEEIYKQVHGKEFGDTPTSD